jgi:hypothetical protein
MGARSPGHVPVENDPQATTATVAEIMFDIYQSPPGFETLAFSMRLSFRAAGQALAP